MSKIPKPKGQTFWGTQARSRWQAYACWVNPGRRSKQPVSREWRLRTNGIQQVKDILDQILFTSNLEDFHIYGTRLDSKWSSRNPRCLVCNDFSCTRGCYEYHLRGFPCSVAQAVSEVSYPSAASAAPPWGGLGVWMELRPGNYRSAMYFFYACYHHLSATSFWSPHRSKTNKPPTCPESLWHMTRHHYLRWFAIGIHPNDQGDELDTSLEKNRLIWAACNFLDGQLNQPTNQRTCGFLWLNDSGGLRRSLGRQVLLYLCHRQLSCESLGIHILFASDFLFSRFSLISLQCQFNMVIWSLTFAELTIHSTEC